MSANNETLSRVLTVALGLCIVCSVVVSTAAVALKPQQEANKARDLKRNILMAPPDCPSCETTAVEPLVNASFRPRVISSVVSGPLDDEDSPPNADSAMDCRSPSCEPSVAQPPNRAPHRINPVILALI